MIDGAFAYAFTAGMVASVNPCGFAMLPAYLSYFLGLEGMASDRSTVARLARALVVSGAVALGFMAVFLSVGILVNAGLQQVIDYAKWLSIVIGLVLIGVGVAVMLGWRIPLTMPRLERGGRTRSAASMFVFGVSYAVASVGCTLPIFLAVFFGGITRDGFLSGLLSFGLYGAGMALVLTALTITLALAEGGLLRVLRSAMRWVDRLAGAFLVVAGAYLIYYWAFNLRFDHTGSLTGGGVAQWVEARSADASNWISNRPWTLGVLFGVLVAVTVGVVLAKRWGTGAAGSGDDRAQAERSGPVSASSPDGGPTPVAGSPAPRHDDALA